MNGVVKEALGLKVYHGEQSESVFNFLNEDFMKPVTNIGISQICQILVLLKQKE